MKTIKISISFLFLLSCFNAFALVYSPIDFSSSMNYSFNSLLGGSSYPTGNVIFDDVPFNIPVSGNNMWHSVVGDSSAQKILDVNVNTFGVSYAYSLINSYWGTTGTYAYIEFIGSDDGYYKFDLYGNSHIRDYNQNVFTNSINNTTAKEVFQNNSGQRLDMQTYQLPATFADEMLTNIRIVDNGINGLQRSFVGGLTVRTEDTAVPEPTTILLFLSGIFGFYFKKKLT